MKIILLKFNLIAFFALMLTACSATATPEIQSSLPNIIPQPSTPTEIETPLANATRASTPTMLPTNTPTLKVNTPSQTMILQPTFPPELTQTPGIMATATSFAATTTADYLNNSALMGPLADMLGIMQYFKPEGTPAKSWHDIPIMPQATAGQEFKSDIYSYKATATLAAASKFYNDQAISLNWSCFPSATGSGGTGSNADHSVTMMCQGLVISMTSFDNDTSHVIVILNRAP
jgi:hypothetical protein